MHTITRGVVGLALLTAAAIGLAGCSTASTGAAPAQPEHSTTPSATATTTPTVAFGDAPVGPQAPSCGALLPADAVQSLVPGARASDPLTSHPHASASWLLVAAAGGTVCCADNGVSPLDDVEPGTRDDPVHEGIQLQVLPHAAQSFAAAADDAPTPLESTTTVSCAASDSARVFCRGGVLAGNAWVDLSVTRVQSTSDATPEVMEPKYRALLEQVRAQVAASPAGTATGDDPADGDLTVCSPDRANAVSSVTLRDRVYGTDTPSAIEDYAQNRIRAASCTFTADGPYTRADALYERLPGAGWYVEQRLAAGLIDRAGRIDLPGLGERDGAWRTCDESACTIDVVHDGTWTQYVLSARVAPNTSSAIERWAASSFSV